MACTHRSDTWCHDCGHQYLGSISIPCIECGSSNNWHHPKDAKSMPVPVPGPRLSPADHLDFFVPWWRTAVKVACGLLWVLWLSMPIWAGFDGFDGFHRVSGWWCIPFAAFTFVLLLCAFYVCDWLDGNN